MVRISVIKSFAKFFDSAFPLKQTYRRNFSNLPKRSVVTLCLCTHGSHRNVSACTVATTQENVAFGQGARRGSRLPLDLPQAGALSPRRAIIHKPNSGSRVDSGSCLIALQGNSALACGKSRRVMNQDYTPLLIFMHDVIILTQNEAMGARSPTLAVAAPIASFWISIVTYLMHKY